MREVGRIHVLKGGIFEGKYKSGSTKELHPLEAGTEIPVSYDQPSTCLVAESNSVMIHAQRSGNGISIHHYHDAIVTHTDSSLALPPYAERTIVKQEFGHRPGGSKDLELGQPDSFAHIEYEGHPARDTLDPIFDGVKQPVYPDAEVLFSRDRDQGTLLFHGPSAEAIVRGSVNADANTYRDSSGEPFPTKVIMGAYLVEKQQMGSDIEVFTAIKPESDGLVRVRSNYPYIFFDKRTTNGYDQSRALDELAAFSVLANHLDAPEYEDLRMGLPLSMMSYLGLEMGARIDGRPFDLQYEELKDRFGVAWVEMRNNLPAELVVQERDRLAAVLGVDYKEFSESESFYRRRRKRNPMGNRSLGGMI